jgi:hypothetical protein
LRRTNRAAVFTSCVSLCAAMLFGIASAPVAARIPAGPTVQPVAVLTVISGDVLMRTTSGDFRSAIDGTVLYVGTVLRTSADARALITFFEGSTVELDPASDIAIEHARSDATLAQALGRGLQVVMRLTTADSRYEQTTPAATASVRGVEFEIAVASGLGSISTTVLPTARLVSLTVATPSVQVVAETQTTTERSNTTSVATRSSYRGDRVRRVLVETIPSAPSAGRTRDDDGKDDRKED